MMIKIKKTFGQLIWVGVAVVLISINTQSNAQENVGLERISYEVVVTTGKGKGSGTNHRIWIRIFGPEGKTEKLLLDHADKNDFAIGATDTFTFSASQVGVEDVGSANAIEFSVELHPERNFAGTLDLRDLDDWGIGELVTVNRLIDGKVAKGCDRKFVYKGAAIGDYGKNQKSIVMWANGYRGNPLKSPFKRQVVSEQWVWKYNGTSDKDMPIPWKENIAFELNTESWANRSKSKSLSTEVSISGEADIFSVKVKESLKVTGAWSSVEAAGEKLALGKKKSQEVELKVPAMKGFLVHQKFVVDGVEYKLGKLVLSVPDPSTLAALTYRVFEFSLDEEGEIVDVNGNPASETAKNLIKDRGGFKVTKDN